MRVLHVITGLGGGGAEGALYRLVTGDKGNEHYVVSLSDEGYYGARLVAAGTPVYALEMRSPIRTMAALLELRAIVRAARPSVIQTWLYHADLVGAVAGWAGGCRRIVWGIRNTSPDSPNLRPGTRAMARICAPLSRVLPRAIVSCSVEAANSHANFGYARDKITVVPNGYDLERFGPDYESRLRIRRDLSVRNDTLLLGMVARWDAEKDHANLLRGLAIYESRSPRDWICVLVGEGMTESNADLVALVHHLGLRDRIRFLGWRTDVAALMNALDLQILSSVGEAFPNVLCEAMACGTPCVTTDVGDAAEIVGDTGWVVAPRDPAALSHAIGMAAEAKSDKVSWTTRQERARGRVEQLYSLDRMIERYRSVWTSVAAPGST